MRTVSVRLSGYLLLISASLAACTSPMPIQTPPRVEGRKSENNPITEPKRAEPRNSENAITTGPGVRRAPMSAPSSRSHDGYGQLFSDQDIAVYYHDILRCRKNHPGDALSGTVTLAVEILGGEQMVLIPTKVPEIHRKIHSILMSECPDIMDRGQGFNSPYQVQIFYYFPGVYISNKGQVVTDRSAIRGHGPHNSDDEPFAFSEYMGKNVRLVSGATTKWEFRFQDLSFYYRFGNTEVIRTSGTLQPVGRGFTPAEGVAKYKDYLYESGSLAGIRRFWARGGMFVPVSSSRSVTDLPASSTANPTEAKGPTLLTSIRSSQKDWFFVTGSASLRLTFSPNSTQELFKYDCHRKNHKKVPTCWGTFYPTTGVFILQELTREEGGNQCVLLLESRYQIKDRSRNDGSFVGIAGKPVWEYQRYGDAPTCYAIDCHVSSCQARVPDLMGSGKLVQGDRLASEIKESSFVQGK